MKNFLIVFFVLVFAFSVLGISVFRTASVSYDFAELPSDLPQNVLGDTSPEVDYNLPYPGKIMTDSPLWPVKALRDRVWLGVISSPTRETELKLLFADKRLGMAKLLFERGKPEIGLSTLTKAEKYLEEASLGEERNRHEGYETKELLQKLANASLKHYEVMEHIKTISPEEVKPTIENTQGYPKKAFERARNALLDKNMTPPENPFAW